MSPKKFSSIILPVLYFLCSALPFLHAATGERAMVVTPDPLATQAAVDVLERGGNAVDAAIAAQWVLNVVQPQASGLGGGGQILFYDVGTRRILFFDGSVKAPEEAFPEMFLGKNGELPAYQPDRNTGGLPVGVPGLLRTLEEIHSQYGTRKFPFLKLLDPAIRQAEEGVPVSAALAQALQEQRSRFLLSEPDPGIFFENGQPLREGQKLFQPDLAKTFRLIQTKGAEAFYKGEIAKAMVHAVRKNPFREGFLDYQDLARYQVARRDPVHGSYQGYDIFSASPPFSGGVMLIRALNLFSHFSAGGPERTAEGYYLLEEVQKVAFSNFAAIADPDLFDVPLKELLSQEWAQEHTAEVRFEKVFKADNEKRRTLKETAPARASILVADAQGNRIVLASTLGDAFGAAVTVPGFGFLLNNQLADFDADPGTAKDPAATNVATPGQRPRSPSAPVFIFKEGRPFLIAAADASEDPSGVLFNLLVSKVDFGASCSETLSAARVLNGNGVMQVEPRIHEDGLLRTRLELLGQTIEKKERLGVAQMICFDGEFGKIEGLSDPRGAGEAAGF